MSVSDRAKQWQPDRKHAFEAGMVIAVWLVGVFGLDVPAEVASAATFLVGYLIPNPT